MNGDLAREYERQYPGTGLPEAQKTERMERMVSRGEAPPLRPSRRKRTSSFLIPELPWLKEER